MQPKDITGGREAREGMMRGISKAADQVAVTLGPIGLMASIEFPGLDPIDADDGITVLKHLRFEDPLEEMGLLKLKKSSGRTSSEGRDGTATTAALTKAFCAEALRELGSDDSRSREVRERLAAGLRSAVAQLEAMRRPTTREDVESIARTSSLDPEVAKIIADMVEKIGPNGAIEVVKAQKIGYFPEVVLGARFQKGSVSQYFLNRETEECVLENAHVLLVDRKVSLGAQLKSVMDAVAKTGRKDILIIADDVDGLALASLTQASTNVSVMAPDGSIKQGSFNVVAVRNPYTATPGRDFLRDMAALTGATVVSEEAGMRLSEATEAVLGFAERVVVTKDSTTISGCRKSDALAARVAAIKAEAESTTSEYQRGLLQDRLAMLDGGMGRILVGCYTDTEFNAKKYKFDNAVNAAQSALREGKLPGGGAALLKVRAEDRIFREALQVPFRKMAENAGVEWHRFINAVADPGNASGVDFVSKRVVDMFEAGIVDSFKVTRLALESAVATATALVSYGTATTVAKKDEKKDRN